MLRVPGSFNSKNNRQVQIIQKPSGTLEKVFAQLLYDKFFTYLVNKYQTSTKYRFEPNNTILPENNVKLSSQVRQSLTVIQRFFQKRNKKDKNKTQFRAWIEALLKTAIYKDRKYCIWRILVPYLINVRHLEYDDTFNIINKWVRRCSELEPLDFDSDYKIRDAFNRVGSYLPIRFDDLKEENRRLYDIVSKLLPGEKRRRGC